MRPWADPGPPAEDDDWAEHNPYAQDPYLRRGGADRQTNGAVRPAPPNGTPLTRLPGPPGGDSAVPEPAAGPVPPLPAAYDDPPTEVLRRYVPANEVLERETRDGTSAVAPTGTAHPPRAVVRRRRARRRALEWPFLVVFALVAAFGIRALAVQTFYIPSGSMHETLLEGDRVLVNKLSYRLHDVHRGDVVVFRRPPGFPVPDQDLIKRVIALPGERVEGRDRTVFVDGRPLVEPYVEPVCDGTEAFGPITVPAGQLWVMGDNRCDSSDSRVFGPIEDDLVVGRAFILIWPVGRIAWL